jgi:hypothetical protein
MSSTLRHLARRLRINLWTMIIAPSTWALHFLFCYSYAAVKCARLGRAAGIGDVRIAIAIATLIALAIVAANGYVAWVHMNREGDPPPYQDSTAVDRARFLATAKLLLAGLSFIAIVFTAIPAFIFEDCR